LPRFRLPAGAGTALALLGGFHLPPGCSAAILAGTGGLGLAFAVATRRRLVPRSGGIAAAVILLGGAAGGLRRGDVPPLPTRERTVVCGKVVGWERGRNGVSVRLLVPRFEGRRLDPPRSVRVVAGETWGSVPRAGWLAATGRLEGSRRGTVPGARNPDAAATLVVDRGSLPRWGPGEGGRLVRARDRLLDALDRRLTGFPRRFAEAILLGRGRALTEEERGWFRRTGTTHLTAVSGLHVGMAALFATLLLAGAPVRARLLGRGLAAWGYAALAAGAPSALRAATVVSAASVGSFAGRTRGGVNWLALAVPWLLWCDPGLAGSLSFRLSLGAVAGIFLALDLAGTAARRGIVAAVATSLGAQWGTLPASVGAFGTAAPAALAVNLVAVPLAGLFLPAVALSLLANGAGWRDEPFSAAAAGAATLLEAVVHRGAHLAPCVTGLPSPSRWVGLLGWLLPLVWLSLTPASRHRALMRGGAAVAALGVAAGVFVVPPPPRGPWVAFLDVGQGDTAVIRTAEGGTWVVDVGDDRGPGDAVRNALSPFLRNLRIRGIDALVLSHRHRDHVGALASLLEERRVRRVYDTGIGPEWGTSGVVDSLLAVHGLLPCLVAAGETLEAGGGTLITVEGPEPRGGTEGEEGGNLNDASLILRLRDGPLSVLFAGDAERAEEAAAAGRPLAARILKVGHHGSDTSSGPAFLEAVSPGWGVVSVGEGNRFGHPAGAVLDRLAARGARVHRTDRDGTAIFRLRGDSLEYRRFPPRPADPGTLPP
jgi:competence protein ComEC